MTAEKRLDRRTILKGLARMPMAGLPLAAVLADPLIARAVAARTGVRSLELNSGRTVSAALAVPGTTPAPAVLLVHEWWGLNDQIKSVAMELANQGYVALAIDLYGGNVATDRDSARAYMSGVVSAEAQETLAGWIAWLKADELTNGKVATIGWCFGGGWALNASLIAPTDATIVYYGSVGAEFGGVGRAPADLAALRGPVLGHYATEDGWIDRAMVNGFESRMAEAGKAFTSHWYEANHAFANPTQARYDEADAKLAWKRTLAFLKATL